MLDLIVNFFKAGLGSVGSQFVGWLALPIIARLYDPSHYAEWAIVMAVAGILGVVACFRYELAIVLPQKNNDACSIFWWCILSSLGVAIFCSIITLNPFFGRIILGRMVSSPILFLLPVLVFTFGCIQAIKYWCVRQKAFLLVSIAQTMSTSATVGFQILYAMFRDVNSFGLILGSFIGQIICLLCLGSTVFYYKIFPKFNLEIFQNIPAVIMSHKNFAQYSTPYSLFGVLRNRASVFVFETFSSAHEVGLYVFAHRILNLPLTLIVAALRPVMFEEAARLGVKKSEDKINRILFILGFIVTPFVVLYFFYSKELFVLFFGEKWADAGGIGKYLIVPVFVFIFSSWLDRILDILGQQKLVLVLEGFFASISIAVLWFAFYYGLGISWALFLQSIVLTLYALVYLYLSFDRAKFAKKNLFRLFVEIACVCLISSFAFILIKKKF